MAARLCLWEMGRARLGGPERGRIDGRFLCGVGVALVCWSEYVGLSVCLSVSRLGPVGMVGFVWFALWWDGLGWVGVWELGGV